MTTIGELASYVRSKNAGPLWMTVDFFFDSAEAFERAGRSASLDPATLGPLLAVDPGAVLVFRLPMLNAIKVSVPRPVAQGSVGERDMHAGQQYVPLLGLPVD